MDPKDVLKQVSEALWPDGNPDHEWSPDTLYEISEAMEVAGYGPPEPQTTMKHIMDMGPWHDGGLFGEAASAAASVLAQSWVDAIENEDTAEFKLPALLKDVDEVVERLQKWQKTLRDDPYGDKQGE